MPLAPGTRLGSYEVTAPLGGGGMGELYRAHQANLQRDVAIKVLPASVAADPDRIARFEREARAVAALSHPNILAIHDFGSDGGVHYAVTELLEGQTLREALHRGPMPVARTVTVATHIARGLEAAHTRGIIHRDLKPENVFVLNDGQVKVLDFGLAKASAPAEAGQTAAATVMGATEAGTVLGTAGYMSPEQVRGEPVDYRSDLFSLGCVLYEMLASRRAFAGPSSIDTMHATLHADPPTLATLAGVPPALARSVGSTPRSVAESGGRGIRHARLGRLV